MRCNPCLDSRWNGARFDTRATPADSSPCRRTGSPRWRCSPATLQSIPYNLRPNAARPSSPARSSGDRAGQSPGMRPALGGAREGSIVEPRGKPTAGIDAGGRAEDAGDECGENTETRAQPPANRAAHGRAHECEDIAHLFPPKRLRVARRIYPCAKKRNSYKASLVHDLDGMDFRFATATRYSWHCAAELRHPPRCRWARNPATARVAKNSTLKVSTMAPPVGTRHCVDTNNPLWQLTSAMAMLQAM